VLPFPEPWELIAVFEGEPTLTDADLPWVYNRVSFSLVRGSELIECAIEPSSRQIDFNYVIDGRVAVALVLRQVAGLRIYQAGGTEGLVVLMEDESRGDLEVQVSPDIRFKWRDEPSLRRRRPRHPE
jgi:hypothetical protein